MIQGLYTYAATAVVAGALAAAGAWQVQGWRWQAKTLAAEQARADAQAQADRSVQADARQQIRFNDAAAARHAQALAAVNQQLGDARAQIAKLSDRPVFSADTVSMLNNIGTSGAGGVRLPATASHAGSAPTAAARSAFDAAPGYATERDTAQWIATCRAQYATVASQLNAVLDIEQNRRQAHDAAATNP